MPSIAQFRKAPRLFSSDLTFSVISFVNLMTHLRPVPLLFSIECNSWNNVRRDEDDGFKLGIFSLGKRLLHQQRQNYCPRLIVSPARSLYFLLPWIEPRIAPITVGFEAVSQTAWQLSYGELHLN